MFDSSSYDNPTPLAHADASRDVLPRGAEQCDVNIQSINQDISKGIVYGPRNIDLSRETRKTPKLAPRSSNPSTRCPVWGYAAKTNIDILDVAQNTLIRMIVGACRYMRNDEIRNAIKIPSFKSHIQKLAKNFLNSLNSSENVNMQNLENYTARIKRKRPRSILLDSYIPP
ncbi:uncharacterized protein TNCV_2322181 [Trichonephila clavipes]|nr:uncharacterized protein TNCV_2322181 [Trichonephila clavipes]